MNVPDDIEVPNRRSEETVTIVVQSDQDWLVWTRTLARDPLVDQKFAEVCHELNSHDMSRHPHVLHLIHIERVSSVKSQTTENQLTTIGQRVM